MKTIKIEMVIETDRDVDEIVRILCSLENVKIDAMKADPSVSASTRRPLKIGGKRIGTSGCACHRNPCCARMRTVKW